MSEHHSIDLTFERGLIESVEDSMLPPGACAKCQNWVPDPAGNLRVRPGWLSASGTGDPSVKKGWGIGLLSKQHEPTIVQHDEDAAAVSASTSVTATATWPATTSSGSTLVLLAGLGVTTMYDPSTFSWTVPDGWTRADTPTSISSCYGISGIWYKANAAPASGNVAVTANLGTSQAAGLHIGIVEVKDLDATPIVTSADTYAYQDTTREIPVGSNCDSFGSNSTTDKIAPTGGVTGYANGDRVVFTYNNGWVPEAMPSGETAPATRTYYYVRDLEATQFKLAATLGGTALTWSTSGTSGQSCRIVREGSTRHCLAFVIAPNFTDGGTHTFTDLTNDFTTLYKGTIHTGLSTRYAGAIWGYKILDPGTALTWTNSDVNSVTNVKIHMTSLLLETAGYNESDQLYFVADAEGANELSIQFINSNEVSTGSWTEVESMAISPDIVPVAFCSGMGRVFWTHPNMTYTHGWKGPGYAVETLSNGPPGGRCNAFHKNRLFVGGTAERGYRLYYSEVGDYLTWWTGTAGYIDISSGDGEPIEDITPFEDGLVVGKASSIWYLVGSGPDSFRLIRLPSSTGIAPGRTITPTAYGALLAGPKNVQVFSGGSVAQISGNIRETYGQTGNWISGATVDDFYYILDEGSGTIWALDLAEGVWHTEVVGSASTEGPACLYNHLNRLMFAPKNATTGSLLAYRLQPGETRAKDFSTLSEPFEVWTPEIWLAGPEQAVTPRQLFLKLRQRGSGVEQTGLTVTPYYDGREQNPVTAEVEPSAAGVYRHRFNVGQESGISSVQFRFAHTPTGTQTVLWDIEEVVFGFDVEKIR